MTNPLLIALHDGTLTLTLNRPERHNAFDGALIAALDAAFITAERDPAVRLVVLAAAGRSFCAGADLDWMKAAAHQNHDENLADARRLAGMLDHLSRLSKPTIARVQGAAYGGGVGLIAACDMAIALDSARFALTEVRLGLIPATISPYVIAAIGVRSSRRYMLTAESFDAPTAHALGLLHEICHDETALDQVLAQLIGALKQNGPQALAACKTLIADMAHAPSPLTPQYLEESTQRIANLRATEEAQEGMSAFFARRPPRWCHRTGHKD